MTWEQFLTSLVAFACGLAPWLVQFVRDKHTRTREVRADTVGEWVSLYNDTRGELDRARVLHERCDRDLSAERNRRRYLEAVMRSKGWHLDPEPPEPPEPPSPSESSASPVEDDRT